MNETLKTVVYAGVALVVALVAAITYPRQEDFEPPDLVGKPLFEGFSNPEDATELRIVKFQEDVGELTEFEVARDAKTGLWVIPSSSNYPADAGSQMLAAATSLIDLLVLGVAPEIARPHETYGVVEPSNQMQASQEGVGLLVSVKSAKGQDLAKLIIGKRVKGNLGQRFVRIPGMDSVYVVKIESEKFPTEFARWIERDLLKINTLDIQDVTLKDYSVIRTPSSSGPRGKIEQRFEAKVTWNADENKWVLDELVQFKDGQRIPTQLLETEELNAENLNDLKAALGDMRIIGVLRKPAGLGTDLKTGTEFLKDEESRLSLMNRGFYLHGESGGDPELRAASGEMFVGLGNGVQYVLRFGEIADTAQSSEEGKLSRYLFVSARLDQSKFPPLELDPLPDGVETAREGSNASVGEKSDLELERERIRKENQRKQDEREESLKRANQFVTDLNARFADWYYIISEDEYKRVHLGQNDLIRESAAAAETGFGIDAFRQLQKEGLKKFTEEGSD